MFQGPGMCLREILKNILLLIRDASLCVPVARRLAVPLRLD